jgi:hypothetical protein
VTVSSEDSAAFSTADTDAVQGDDLLELERLLERLIRSEEVKRDWLAR